MNTILATSGGAVTTYWATSSTTAATAEKAVTCSGYTKNAGNIIAIQFSTANTAATPTLNINSTGAAALYVGGSTPNSTTNTCKWSANSTVVVVYDGTYYRIISIVSAANVKNWLGGGSWYGTCATSATTRAKASTIDNYRLCTGAIVTVNFTAASTYTANSVQLNVNSTGAKSIYANGAVTSSTNTLLWPANTVMVFVFDGTYYRLVKRIDPTSNDVFEEGAANGWKYRKWNNGRLEAWGYESCTTDGATEGSWTGYKNLPVTLANNGYYVFCQVTDYRFKKAYTGERTTTNFRIACATTEAATADVNFYLVGEWK